MFFHTCLQNIPFAPHLKHLIIFREIILFGFLTLCKLENFSCFFSHLLTFFSNLTLSENYFRNTISVSNSLNPDQARQHVGPDLDENHVQRLSADNTSRKIIEVENAVHCKF